MKKVSGLLHPIGWRNHWPQPTQQSDGNLDVA